MRALSAAILLLTLSGCALPSPDAAPHVSRMGRFLGLVSRCGCAEVSPGRMLAEYPLALGSRYSEAEIRAMRGYVDAGLSEHYDNQMVICRTVCAQACMVESVSRPLDAGRPGIHPCPVTERDLDLPLGHHSSAPPS